MSNPRASSALASLDTRLPPLSLSCPTAALVQFFLTRHKLVIIQHPSLSHPTSTCYLLLGPNEAGSELVRQLAYKVSCHELSRVVSYYCSLPYIHALIKSARSLAQVLKAERLATDQN